MTERFAIYRYETEGEPAEVRYSFAPLDGVGYGGRGGAAAAEEPEAATPEEPRPAGHLEAPEGTRIVDVEPPTLEIPGRGRVDISAVIGVTEGDAAELGRLIRWHPAG
ncbi:hypothetical protein [Falsiroseomonas selenitidurans]|uniref:Uncharacterized protein n=1 Tax=Falsiroseomonas selenitidurans TaxID=2716335 RepID=A0ABX1E0W6_9PROT|nr:hypothetical protein [Falsiroseomonas selenitidurans]NKC30746.1 hypothetical protein [Falsiroseomonas selenitidurans]